jgi:single-stranded-DNA-specific exonuclease
MYSSLLSFSQKQWSLEECDIVRARHFERTLGLSPLVARCLEPMIKDRNPEEWLSPSFEYLHDPFLMKNMETACVRIEKAFTDRERIRIVTDYDVDGTTSSLILQSLCRILGAGDLIDYHIPSRFTEGYGFSLVAAKKAVEDKVGLIITADIGVRDHVSVSYAAQAGVDVIVCDHHLPSGESVPKDAVAVLCPPQDGCTYPNPALAACGVSFKLAHAMMLRSNKYKDRPEMINKILHSMLKIVSIGTVADVVSLATIENRSIVALGLRELQNGTRHSVGLQALLEVSGVNTAWITASSIGYQIAPRINAAGRLRRATEVIELLDEKDPRQARILAKKLNDLNLERREIERRLVKSCFAHMPSPLPDFITIWGHESEGWHRGIVGIVASRIRDKTNRSTAVITVCGEEARGSVRTVPGVHAVKALTYAKDLLPRFGGHAAAAGFSLPVKHLEALQERLDTFVRVYCSEVSEYETISLRAECAPEDIDLAFARSLYKLGPFGKENPKPLLWLKNVRPKDIRLLKDTHIKFKAGPHEVLWWNSKEHLSKIQSMNIDIAAEVDINRYKQKIRVQLIAQDVRESVMD